MYIQTYMLYDLFLSTETPTVRWSFPNWCGLYYNTDPLFRTALLTPWTTLTLSESLLMKIEQYTFGANY